MATVVTNPACGKFGFFANLVSDDISGCEEIVAAPGVGSIFVDHLTISSSAAIAITIGEGETVPGAIDTDLLGPIEFFAGQSIVWNFLNGGMLITALTSLVCLADGAGDVCIFVSGHIQ